MTTLQSISSRVVLFAMILALNACASYDVVFATGSLLGELGKQSVRVVWRAGNTDVSILKQQSGSGLQKPTITDSEKSEAFAEDKRLRADLSTGLLKSLSQSIGSYIANGTSPECELVIEMGRDIVRTDGSKEITLIAFIRVPSGKDVLWARSIRIAFSAIEADDTIVRKFSEAIVDQMKSGGLVR